MVAALSRRNIEPSDLRLIKDIVEVSGWDSSWILLPSSRTLPKIFTTRRLPARTVELGTFQVVKSAKPTLYFRIYCHNSTHEIDSTSPIQ